MNLITKNIYHANCLDFPNPCRSLVVSDPPYNIGYKYLEYEDRMTEDEYLKLFEQFRGMRCVFIHYPEETIKYIVPAMGAPKKVVSWVYNSNTKRQHRMISWYNCSPDFSRVKQPYKNLNDKRIIERIANGSEGADLYDWWDIDLVKNTSDEKTEYTNQIPERVIYNILKTTANEDDLVFDPFSGSGTTCAVAQKMGLDWVGCDVSEKAVEVAKERINKLCQEIQF